MPYASESRHPWLNTVQYPFVTREFDSRDGWMSYVDHGRGRPIVFVHGNPTWSYLYRHLMRELGQEHRCIAPDLLGYGLSDKPRGVDYRPEVQAQRFAALMDYLQLDDVTLVVQCAGGPVGLSWAIENPGRVRDIVLFNTWMWPLDENMPARRLASLVGNPLNRFYYRALNASPTFILPALFADRHRISRPSKIQYLEPFREYRERLALYAMIEGLTQSRSWFSHLWDRREAIAAKPALLLWGEKDPIFGHESRLQFESMFADCRSVLFPDSGRYVPEEAPVTSLDQMRWFLARRERVSGHLL